MTQMKYCLEKDNLKRLNRSAKRFSIPEIPDDIFIW